MIIQGLALAAVAALGIGSGAQAATYNAKFTLVSAVDVHSPIFDHQFPKQGDVLLPEWWGVTTGRTAAATVTIEDYIGHTLWFTLRTASHVIFSDQIAIYNGSFSGVTAGPDFGATELRWDGSLKGFGTISARGAEDPWFKMVDGTFQLQPVPLPAGVLLLPAALAGFGLMRRRKGLN